MVSDWNEQLKIDGKATCPHEVNIYLKIIDLNESPLDLCDCLSPQIW